MKKGKNGTKKRQAKGKGSRSGAGRPAGRPAPEREHGKGVATSGIIVLGKTTHTRKDAMKDYSIHHVPGEHLKFEDRQILARDWNRQVNNGPRPTIRGFARDHGLAAATWHREYKRGKVDASVPDQRDGRRREYNEYDPFKAQDVVNEGNGNKGAAKRVTNMRAAMKFATAVLPKSQERPFNSHTFPTRMSLEQSPLIHSPAPFVPELRRTTFSSMMSGVLQEGSFCGYKDFPTHTESL